MILLSSVLPWHPASPRLPVRAHVMCLYRLRRNRLAGNITRDTKCIFHLTQASVASIFHHRPIPLPATLPFSESPVFCLQEPCASAQWKELSVWRDATFWLSLCTAALFCFIPCIFWGDPLIRLGVWSNFNKCVCLKHPQTFCGNWLDFKCFK